MSEANSNQEKHTCLIQRFFVRISNPAENLGNTMPRCSPHGALMSHSEFHRHWSFDYIDTFDIDRLIFVVFPLLWLFLDHVILFGLFRDKFQLGHHVYIILVHEKENLFAAEYVACH